MREIRFRAWNKILKQFVPIWSAIETRGDDVLRPINYDFIIEQYTGLNDKNGVEIYDGDIVMWRDGESIRYAQVAFAPDINFLTCDYVFNYGRFAYKDTENHLTVIGNIHTNADLLNDTDRISPDDIGNDIHDFLHGGDK